MPVIKLQHVTSASSEDTNHPADNLLSLETYRKWQCASTGEKQAVVVLQFEKSSQIHSIDIGNNGSAFVEVLVGRTTGSSSSEDYQVLLVASSFMSPVEGKAWSNTTRVRMFGKDKLSKNVAEQKWDKVKLVCTQPYNKNEKYGLSFVKFHSPPETDTEAVLEQGSGSSVTRLGAFTLKEERKTLPSGSLFFRKDKEKTEAESKTVSLAAQARQVSASVLSGGSEGSIVKPVSLVKPVDTSDTRRRVGGASSSAPPTKRPKVDSRDEKEEQVESVPFGKLMEGVVFALSGFKNPYRGELREKAVQLGAKYEPDWGPTCTHLICAFPNTPKYNQVKSVKGMVVKKEWVLDTHKKKRRLPARKYRFHTGHMSESEEEDEEYDKKESEIFRRNPAKAQAPEPKALSETVREENVVTQASVLKEEEQQTVAEQHESEERNEEDLYGGSTDEGEDEEDGGLLSGSCHEDDDDYDTDEEIRRLKEKQAKRQDTGQDMPSGTTSADEEMDTGSADLMSLPDLFAGCRFFVYGDQLTAQNEQLLKRYIVAYAGCIEEYMSEDVTHVVSCNDWDENFDQALAENDNLVFVRPAWVFMCHSARTLLSYKPYQITK